MSLIDVKLFVHYPLLVCLSIVLCMCRAQDVSKSVAATPSSESQSANSKYSSGLHVVPPPKEGQNKRDVKLGDFSGSATAKSYDPPAEYYRGSGSASGNSGSSSSSSSSSKYNHRDSSAADYASKPIAFPDASERSNYDADYTGNRLASSYNNWQQLKGSAPSLHDRISVGHYGSSGHNPSGYTGSSTIGSYAYEGRPYTHQVDYPPTTGHYPTHAGGYYGNGGGGGGGGGVSAEGIPFDVYGSRGHYAGAGGEYSYTYPDIHDPATHKGYPEISPKALLAKSFLIPLASAAVLGITAALVSNPLLLQLGTVSGPSVIGKRKRRDLQSLSSATAATATGRGLAAKKLPVDVLAYRWHQQREPAHT